MIDPSGAVRRIKNGEKLTQPELTEIRNALLSGTPNDLHNLVQALALSSTPTKDNISLVEKYLHSTDDDWALQGVIYALCHHWNLTGQYLDELISFTPASKWLSHPSAAIAAFSALGKYMHESRDRRVFDTLVALLDEGLERCKTDDPQFIFDHLATCYSAIDRAIRGREALLDQPKLRSVAMFRPEIIASARALAGRADDHLRDSRKLRKLC